MGLVTLHRRFDFAAPRLHAERDRQHRTFRPVVLPEPRGCWSAASPRGSFFRWLRASASLGDRNQRMSFRASADTPSSLLPAGARMFASPSLQDGAGGDALTYPERMAALGRVVVSTRGVLAAQAHVAAHKAARSHTH